MSKLKERILTLIFVVVSIFALFLVTIDSLGCPIFPVYIDSRLTGKEPDAPENAFSVMTFNIAHGRGTALHQVLVRNSSVKRNLEYMGDYLKAVSPDIIGLQEVDIDCNWSGNFDHARFIAKRAEIPYCKPGINNVNEGSYRLIYGNALLSRHSVDGFKNYPFGQAKTGEKGFLAAEIEMQGRIVTFVVAHLDYKYAENRRRQVGKMIEILKSVKTPLVVMGDFNCSLTDNEDSLRLLVEALGLHSHVFPDRQGATFPAKRPVRRIDYILISKDLEFLAYEAPPKMLTDHLPVIAVLKFKGK